MRLVLEILWGMRVGELGGEWWWVFIVKGRYLRWRRGAYGISMIVEVNGRCILTVY